MAEPLQPTCVDLLRVGEAPRTAAADRDLDFVPLDFWQLAPDLCGGSINDGYSVEAPAQLQRLSETCFAKDGVHPDTVVFSRSSFTRTVYCWAPPDLQLDVGAEPSEVVAHTASFSAWLERVARGDLAPRGVIRPFWVGISATEHMHAWQVLLPASLERCFEDLTLAVEGDGGAVVAMNTNTRRFALAGNQALLNVVAHGAAGGPRTADGRISLRSASGSSWERVEDLLARVGWAEAVRAR